MYRYVNEARRLHAYLHTNHWDGAALTGPDPGVRFNYRVGRYVKSYLPFLPWHDSHYYLQAQAYWVLANWRLADATGDRAFEADAVAASHEMLRRQSPDGAWEYPNPEWSGRVATAEGAWASIALVETFRRTGDDTVLKGALAWNQFVDTEVGYEALRGGLAVNYFAGRPGAAVPNNAAFVARFLGALARVTDDGDLLDRARQLVAFLRAVQRPNGELPYEVAHGGEEGRDHFQCYQYNAFQCVDLLTYLDTTGDESAVPVISALLEYLSTGLDPTGGVFYDCRKRRRRVTYHATVIGAAFAAGTQAGIGDYGVLSERAYRWALDRQRADGSFATSYNDYGVLTDRRSYPRNHTMILTHLLSA
jgi:hypothetical protein